MFCCDCVKGFHCFYFKGRLPKELHNVVLLHLTSSVLNWSCAWNFLSFCGKHFSEPIHVTNGVRQRGVLSLYLCAEYLYDLSNELNNIKAGCYIGEVLLNHLMFADGICVFCPSVRWLQRKPDVYRAYAESKGIIFNFNKTVCLKFKAKSAKSTGTPFLTLGDQNVKSVNQYKYLGIALDAELSDEKDIQRQQRCYQYCAANKLQTFFSRCSNAVKNVLFRSFCTPMYPS